MSLMIGQNVASLALSQTCKNPFFFLVLRSAEEKITHTHHMQWFIVLITTCQTPTLEVPLRGVKNTIFAQV